MGIINIQLMIYFLECCFYMYTQVYDEELAKVAQKWTMQCTTSQGHDSNRGVPGGSGCNILAHLNTTLQVKYYKAFTLPSHI